MAANAAATKPPLETTLSIQSPLGEFFFEEPTLGKRLELELAISTLTQGMTLTVPGQNLAWSMAVTTVLPTKKPKDFAVAKIEGRYQNELIRIGNLVWTWLQALDAAATEEAGDPEGDLKSSS